MTKKGQLEEEENRSINPVDSERNESPLWKREEKGCDHFVHVMKGMQMDL